MVQKRRTTFVILPFDLMRFLSSYAILFTKRASFDLRLAALFT